MLLLEVGASLERSCSGRSNPRSMYSRARIFCMSFAGIGGQPGIFGLEGGLETMMGVIRAGARANEAPELATDVGGLGRVRAGAEAVMVEAVMPSEGTRLSGKAEPNDGV